MLRSTRLAFVGLATFLAGTVLAADHTTASLDTVKKNLQGQKAVLVDVREKEEWDAGHLRDAKLVPLSKLKEGVDPKALAEQLPKDRIIYCHCASGRRVLTAADILKKLGYDTRPLKAGYKDLLQAGFPKAEKR